MTNSKFFFRIGIDIVATLIPTYQVASSKLQVAALFTKKLLDGYLDGGTMNAIKLSLRNIGFMNSIFIAYDI
uniref:Uncharacterized protein n=1 Tax=Megaselia scalaris TaxID=36166 RepID=T1GU66_MEGSC